MGNRLYGSETWVTTKTDMTGLEAAEMRFLRSVTGYTRLDKIRSEVTKKELEISGLQDVRLKYKQSWITTSKVWTTPDSRNTPSNTNPVEEETVDSTGNDGDASMPEQVKRPNPWRKMMMYLLIYPIRNKKSDFFWFAFFNADATVMRIHSLVCKFLSRKSKAYIVL